MKIQEQIEHLMDFDVTHWRNQIHSANGYVIIQTLPDHPEYVRVADLGKEGPGKRAFLAWVPKLKRTIMNGDDMPLTPIQLEAVEALRIDLKSGVKFIRATHILEARFAKAA